MSILVMSFLLIGSVSAITGEVRPVDEVNNRGMGSNIGYFEDCDDVPTEHTYDAIVCKVYDVSQPIIEPTIYPIVTEFTIVPTSELPDDFVKPSTEMFIVSSVPITDAPVLVPEPLFTPTSWIVEPIFVVESTIIEPTFDVVISPIVDEWPIIVYPFRCLEKCWDKCLKCRKNHDYFKCEDRRYKCHDKCWAKQN